MTTAPKGIDWDRVRNWRRSDAAIARQYGCSRSAVAAARRTRTDWRPPHGGRRNGSGAPIRIDWDRADWSLSPREIAEQLGCTVRAVNYARHRKFGPTKKLQTSA